MVGSDVWIGHRATILPGVAVGHGAVVAAGSVVSRDVPPYHVVAGNPARTVRERFDEATARRLAEIAWWDWPVERITEHARLIASGDVAALASLP